MKHAARYYLKKKSIIIKLNNAMESGLDKYPKERGKRRRSIGTDSGRVITLTIFYQSIVQGGNEKALNVLKT